MDTMKNPTVVLTANDEYVNVSLILRWFLMFDPDTNRIKDVFEILKAQLCASPISSRGAKCGRT